MKTSMNLIIYKKKIKTLDLNDLKYLLKVAINGVQKIQTSEKPRLALELCFLEMAIRPKLKTMTNINYAIKKLELLTQDNLKNINKHENNKKAKEQFDIITKTLKTPTKSYTNTKKKCNLSIDEQKHEYHPKENKNINESNNTKQEQKLKKNIFIKKTLELFGGEIILPK